MRHRRSRLTPSGQPRDVESHVTSLGLYVFFLRVLVSCARVSPSRRSPSQSRGEIWRAEPGRAGPSRGSAFRVPPLFVSRTAQRQRQGRLHLYTAHYTLYSIRYILYMAPTLYCACYIQCVRYTVRTLYSAYVIQCVLYILRTLGMFYEPCTQHIYTTQIIHRITHIIHFTQYILPTLY